MEKNKHKKNEMQEKDDLSGKPKENTQFSTLKNSS